MLIGFLSGIFLKGFKEAIGIAVVLVAAYFVLNLIVISVGIFHLLQNPSTISNWQNALLSSPRVRGNWMMVIGISLLVFPKLALGLSGFETGVAVMPLVKGDASDTEEKPLGRIRNTKKLLFAAALIMSVLLIASSFVTALLIPAEAFRDAIGDQPAGEASGRALPISRASFSVISLLFLEVEVCDASEFADVVKVEGTAVAGYRVLRAESSAVPNAIAAFLLHL